MAEEPPSNKMRYRLGRGIVKARVPILIIAILLLIPSLWAYANTKVNYDLLTYLPDSFETMQGQQILQDDFGKGAFSFIITEGMTDEEVGELKDKIADVPHVADALWVDDLEAAGIPKQAIPEKYYKEFNKDDNGDNETMIAVFFDTGTSADETLTAVDQIREIAGDQVFVSGMSALNTDMKNIASSEEAPTVAVAVLGAVIALLVLTDTWLAPLVFLLSIGIAIMWNMGTNIFLGQISFITKVLAAVLQLAVTMDYSIFLWHAYTDERDKFPDDHRKAMAIALGDVFPTLVSSALTASAGFLALCFMTYQLGMDLGIVMAKGCMLGLVGSLTTLPALILIFDKPMAKLSHRPLIGKAKRLGNNVSKHYAVYIIAFFIVLVPAVYGFANKPVYYDLSKMVSGEVSADAGNANPLMKAAPANEKLKEDFDVSTTEMILCDANMPHAMAKDMLNRIEEVDGVKYAIGYDSLVGGNIPEEIVPAKFTDALKAGDYQLIVINSTYAVSTDEANAQIDQINEIIHQYDPNSMLIGEAPATKDLIATTGVDFQVVDWVAIGLIGLILLVVFRSILVPILMVFVIELAIMANLGINTFTGTEMVFIAPVCISTIQLGSTVNYAILLVQHYKNNRNNGIEKAKAVSTAIADSVPAVATSALSFFSATIAVAIYSDLSIISSLTEFMARGAVISMACVMVFLPAFLMLFDKVILKTSKSFRPVSTTPSVPASTEVTA